MKTGCKDYLPVADQHSKILDTPPGVQILLISCSFSENLAKSYVGDRPPPTYLEEILDPPLMIVMDLCQNTTISNSFSIIFGKAYFNIFD